jgi:predicted ATP-grasp superfamily ATP-dependent carboligase
VDAFGDLDQKARIENVALVRDRGRSYTAAAAVAVARGLGAESAAYVSNLENHPTAVRRLAVGRQLLGNGPATLAVARDFARLAQVVRRAGGRVPETLPSGDRHRASTGKRWLRKPLRGGGGSGVADFAPGGRLRASEMLQERIDGVLASVSFVADGRRAALLGLSMGLAGDSAFGAQAYRYCGSLYPLPAEPSLLEPLDALAQATTRAFGLTGVNGLDFVVRDGRAYVLELNPRYSASMELLDRSGPSNIFETHAAACEGAGVESFSYAPPRGVVFGKAIVWARRDVVACDTRGWLDRDEVRDVPFPGERIRRGHPICTVFARAGDAASCYDALRAGAARVERDIEGVAPGANPWA